MTSTALNAIVTEFIPENRKGEGINYYGLSTSLAAAIGPFIGLLLLNMTSFHFYCVAISCYDCFVNDCAVCYSN